MWENASWLGVSHSEPEKWNILEGDLPEYAGKLHDGHLYGLSVFGADVLKVSFSTAFEWFRACEKAGVYELTKAEMDQWRALPDKGCTCCPETPENARSDCHAWSALPMYEMLRCRAFWETAYEK